MEIRLCKDKREWDTCNISQGPAEFLQSWDWGEFQDSIGKEPLRLRFMDNDRVVDQVQGFIYGFPFGIKYLYLPRFCFSSLWSDHPQSSFSSLTKWLKNDRFAFLRCEPIGRHEVEDTNIMPAANRQPQTTLVLSIEKDEDELLIDMHSKTRYNIRLAKRKGVEIRNNKDIDSFWNLNEETKVRDGFKSHEKRYYEKMLESSIVHQFTAFYEGEPIASIICVAYGDTFTYLHGASSSSKRNIMAPYLLQWEAMKKAKRLGCNYYDFWGISPVPKENISSCKTSFHNLSWQADHKWTGVTRFKAGFGGEVKEYPDAINYVLNKMHFNIYNIGRKFL